MGLRRSGIGSEKPPRVRRIFVMMGGRCWVWWWEGVGWEDGDAIPGWWMYQVWLGNLHMGPNFCTSEIETKINVSCVAGSRSLLHILRACDLGKRKRCRRGSIQFWFCNFSATYSHGISKINHKNCSVEGKLNTSMRYDYCLACLMPIIVYFAGRSYSHLRLR